MCWVFPPPQSSTISTSSCGPARFSQRRLLPATTVNVALLLTTGMDWSLYSASTSLVLSAMTLTVTFAPIAALNCIPLSVNEQAIRLPPAFHTFSKLHGLLTTPSWHYDVPTFPPAFLAR